jgi:hypothetical protein
MVQSKGIIRVAKHPRWIGGFWSSWDQLDGLLVMEESCWISWSWKSLFLSSFFVVLFVSCHLPNGFVPRLIAPHNSKISLFARISDNRQDQYNRKVGTIVMASLVRYHLYNAQERADTIRRKVLGDFPTFLFWYRLVWARPGSATR